MNVHTNIRDKFLVRSTYLHDRRQRRRQQSHAAIEKSRREVKHWYIATDENTIDAENDDGTKQKNFQFNYYYDTLITNHTRRGDRRLSFGKSFIIF